MISWSIVPKVLLAFPFCCWHLCDYSFDRWWCWTRSCRWWV